MKRFLLEVWKIINAILKWYCRIAIYASMLIGGNICILAILDVEVYKQLVLHYLSPERIYGVIVIALWLAIFFHLIIQLFYTVKYSQYLIPVRSSRDVLKNIFSFIGHYFQNVSFYKISE